MPVYSVLGDGIGRNKKLGNGISRGFHLLVICLTSVTWWPANHAVGTEP